MNINDVNKFLSENSIRPELALVHPSRYTWSDDLTRVCVDATIGISCFKYFKSKEEYICMGFAHSLDDAKSWVLEGKEIEMWT